MTKKLFSQTSIIILLTIFILVISLVATTPTNAASLATRLKGKILLQVEQNGEAWYVNPADELRYYMGRPADAFNLMRELGIGITNANLEKIQIANANLSGADYDSDGLSDMVEDSIGTGNKYVDSDGDGYSDKDEVLSGFNPLGTGKLNLDSLRSEEHTSELQSH